ncbi:uncharacterized protein LOC123307262 [Coccinella septempunctata]|uniref:uncharacterized protein LOC123307262 n=1 Tax=Coccinella septempunctata TaxID=41139 RepID=UPI001D095EF4|nr:uncharacterized protein LOC123307262 [Coccinella septempunctata]
MNLLIDSYYAKKIKILFENYGITQFVKEPTRITGDSETLVDFVISNEDNIIAHVHDKPKLSDHSVISVNLNCASWSGTGVKRLFRDLGVDNIARIKSVLMGVDWGLGTVEVDEIYSRLNETCQCVVDEIAPIKSRKYNSRVPWMDREIDREMKCRDELYRSFKYCTGGQRNDAWNAFKRKRNDVGQFQRNVENLKKLISVNEVGSANSKFKDGNDDIVFREPQMIAERFNVFFVQSVADIVDAFDPHTIWYNSDNNLYKPFSNFEMIGFEQLKKIMGTIKALVNTSLERGQVPDLLKISTVIPIPKVVGTLNACEFRPVNTLPTIEKVLERTVYEQLLRHVESNEILMSNQSGFRKGYSCEAALQFMITKIKVEMDSDKYVVCVFLDLKRAFETIDRRILMRKLRQYGVSGVVYDWFDSYLRNRKQKVRFNDGVSEELDVDSGVPQGSVLGPLLFLLYVNDVDLFVQCDLINLFADDKVIACSDCSLDEAVRRMNIALEQIGRYLMLNRLRLNTSKTKVMIFTSRSKYNLVDVDGVNLGIDGQRLDVVEHVKYLGFHLDNTLSFERHFDFVHGKISKKLGFFTRLAADLTPTSEILVYNTIIQPHFDYCSTIMFLFNDGKLEKLQKLQNRGMRVILGVNRRTPILSMLDALQWLSVRQRLYYFTMIFIHKILIGSAPDYFWTFVDFPESMHGYRTRTAGNFYLSRVNYSRSMRSLIYKGFQEYNALPTNIKECSNLRDFKCEIKKYARIKK